MGNVKDDDIFVKYEKLDKMCTQSALLTGHLAARYLGEQGLLCFTGASAAFEGPVNFAFAYGITKQATHAISMQLAERVDIPKSSDVVCILPTMIDNTGEGEKDPNSTLLPPG